MARRYADPAKTVTVTDAQLAEARTRADAATARLRAAERANPSAPGWDDEYAAATSAAASAQRRVDALAALRAAQLERSGKRDAAVKSADLDGLAAALAASRDQVAAAAAADHLRALASLASAADVHNKLLADGRARLAELGLAVRDDLVDVATGGEHPEGTLDRGVRAGGVDWTPVPAPGLVAHALLAVFGQFRGPFASMRHVWPAHQVAARPDGLNVPTPEDAGVTLPPAPAPVVPRPAPMSDVMPPAPVNGADVSGYKPGRRAAVG